jgi:N4-gp56 family major capsid protein
MAVTKGSDAGTLQAMYDQMARFALRPELVFDQVADVRQVDAGPRRGSSAVFPLWDEMSAATSTLTDGTDITPATLGDSTVTVTIVEQGNGAAVTRKLVSQSYVQVVSDTANLIGYNAGFSIDSIIEPILMGGDNLVVSDNGTGNTARTDLAAADVLTTADIRESVAGLRTGNAKTKDGAYAGFIHPDVSVDLRAETGGQGWHDPSNYSNAEKRWNAEIGRFGGVAWMETPRCTIWADGGSSTVDAYGTVICGQQSLAKAVNDSEQPEFIIGPVVDSLRRVFPFGWYQLVGYKRYREAALYRIESSSSIGAN